MPQNQSYNSEYFIQNILEPISNKSGEIWKHSDNKMIWLHLDNSKVHNSHSSMQKYKNLVFKRTPHPAYSPDVAPSDYNLFVFLGGKLKGISINTHFSKVGH